MKAVFSVCEYQTKILEEGMSTTEIGKNIEHKFKRREFAFPGPGALVYMMSLRNKWYDCTGLKLIDVAPHIMLYLPKTAVARLGFNGKNGLPDFYDEYPHLSVVHIHPH